MEEVGGEFRKESSIRDQSETLHRNVSTTTRKTRGIVESQTFDVLGNSTHVLFLPLQSTSVQSLVTTPDRLSVT